MASSVNVKNAFTACSEFAQARSDLIAVTQESCEMPEFDVVVVGSIVYDLITYVDASVQPGETRIGSRFKTGAGGKGANQCTMAAFLGANSAIVGKIGDDTFGREYMQSFNNNGVNADHITVEAGASTGVATIIVTETGENTIVVVPGANFQLTSGEIDAASAAIRSAKVVVCQLEVPSDITTQTLRLAKQGGAVTVLNPAPAPLRPLPPDMLSLCDLFCPNQQEATAISGLPCTTESDVEAVLRRLREMGCRLPMVTLGSQGVSYLDGDSVVRVPAPKVKAVDTTGAGDAFVGSLSYFLACRPEMELYDQVSRAVRIASISVTQNGTQSSFPRMKDLPQDLRE